MLSDGGVMRCLRLDDGSLVWRKRLGGTFSASLIAGAGHVYAVSEQGDTHVLQAGDTYQRVAVNRLRQRCVATPAATDGKLFMRTDDWLYCIEGYDSPDSDNLVNRRDPDDLAPDDLAPTRSESEQSPSDRTSESQSETQPASRAGAIVDERSEANSADPPSASRRELRAAGDTIFLEGDADQ